MKVIRHIPDALGKIVHGLMSEWKIYQVIAKIDGKRRGAAERTWVLVGGIKCIAFVYCKA